MKRGFLAISTFLISVCSLSQVMFRIDSLPEYTPPDDIIYIAGDFQGWDPGDPEYALEKNQDGKWFIESDSVPEGTTIEFKFTRGDWGTVEKGIMGEEIPNRVFTFGNGDTLSIIIYNWADAGGASGTTAAENVEIIDEQFYMPQLDRHRRIWIYFPPGYENGEDHYPVIYMHDGQNLFDTYTSFLGEWEVDETLNSLADEGYYVPVVVGIDNGGEERINEYTPWENSQFGGGDGDLYMQFIVETLKPFIDENYRTHPGREFTAIWGSSLGGLISFYGAMHYQDIFGKAGVYSPSYWWAEEIWDFTINAGHQYTMKIYQMTGELEGGSMVTNTLLMDELFQDLGFAEEEHSVKIVPDGEHNEQLWREDFETAYLWLFHSFANNVDEISKIKPLSFYPNPAVDIIYFGMDEVVNNMSVEMHDLSGRLLKSLADLSSPHLKLEGLEPGVYVLTLFTGENIYRGMLVKQ